MLVGVRRLNVNDEKKLLFSSLFFIFTEKAFKDLNKQKENLTKVMNIKHKKLEIQKYLKACNITSTKFVQKCVEQR